MNMLFDIKYALRMLLNKPQFSALSILIMAVGLGLCVYMIAFLSNLLYKEIAVPNGEQLYVVEAIVEGKRVQDNHTISILDYEEIKQTSTSFLHVGAFRGTSLALSNGDKSSRYTGAYVTTNVFDLFSTSAQLGRTFSKADLTVGSMPVAVISERLWKSYFHKKQHVIGSTVQVEGVVTEIIGVMPAKNKYPVGADIWMPATEDILRTERESAQRSTVYVRKKPSVSLDQANAELAGIMKRLAQQFPETNSNQSARLFTLPQSELGDDFKIMSRLMTASVLLVLVLACINVANLLLTRANERSKETAIRLALGAPRVRLIIQMMWESVLICLLGGLIGIFGAGYGLELLNASLPKITGGNTPFWWHFSIDSTLVMQALLLIVFTAFITGIVPAWKMSHCNVNTELRDGTRGAVGKKSGRISRVLVIIEIILAAILLITASVLYAILADTQTLDYGAELDNRLQARSSLTKGRYTSDTQKIQFFERLMPELEKIPGASKVGSMSTLPGDGSRPKSFEPEGFEIVNHKYPKTTRVVAFDNSMKNLGMTLVEGRFFNKMDTKDSQYVAIVTESLAKKYWPEGNILGKRLKFKQGGGKQWLTIVGVIKHVVFSTGLGPESQQGSVFQPYRQQTYRNMSNFISVDKAGENKITEITDAVGRIDPMVPTFDVNFIKDMIARRMAGINQILGIFTIFAFAALFLAATGIYGVLSNTINRRTQELGIRRALGATDEKVMTLLMKQGWGQLAIGLIIGLPLGYLTSLGFVTMLVPQTNNYYYAYGLIPVIIAAVVLFSTYLPAKKAIKLEPSDALRYE